jgi:hypothetical protein
MCDVAIAYLTKRGRESEAERYHELGAQRAQQLGDAYAERESFSLDGPIEPAALPPDVEHALQRELAAFPEVIQAHVGLRRLEHLADEWPAYIVVVVADKMKQRQGEPALVAQLADAIELPGHFHLLLRHMHSDDVKRFEEKVPVPVYRRA